MTIKRLMAILLTNAIAMVASAAPLKVITHQSEQWASDENQGFAPELFNRLVSQSNINAQLYIQPLRRIINTFLDEDYQCFMGGGPLFDEKINLINSLPMSEGKIFIFSRQGDEVVHEFAALAGRSVALTAGFDRVLPENMKNIVNLEVTENSEAAFKMLLANRVDVLIGFNNAFTRDQLSMLSYDEDFPLHSTQAQLTCKDSKATRALIETFDNALVQGHKENRFDDLYQRYNRSIPALYQKP